jgi:hypothetical protein
MKRQSHRGARGLAVVAMTTAAVLAGGTGTAGATAHAVAGGAMRGCGYHTHGYADCYVPDRGVFGVLSDTLIDVLGDRFGYGGRPYFPGFF